MTTIATLEELLAHAQILEREAVERYRELADQMLVHHQPELAELFLTMARVEDQHVDKVEELAGGRALPRLAPWELRWPTLESPVRVPIGHERFRMRPRRALAWVLACAERAYDFFAGVASSSPDPAARRTAGELAEEERQHAVLLRDWLVRYPTENHVGRPRDLDEPAAQD